MALLAHGGAGPLATAFADRRARDDGISGNAVMERSRHANIALEQRVPGVGSECDSVGVDAKHSQASAMSASTFFAASIISCHVNERVPCATVRADSHRRSTAKAARVGAASCRR